MRYALGMDIGGTRTKIGLVNLKEGTVLKKIIYPTEKSEGDFLAAALYHGNKCVESVDLKDILGIGVAASGYVHREGGEIDSGNSGFIPFFPGYPLGEKLGGHLGMPCKVENDAAAGCLGEALYGAGDGYKRVLMLTLGTGVGIGFIRNGIIDEESALLHMAGHVKVSQEKEEGEHCYCGIGGCLESLCSGTALSRRAGLKYKENVSCEQIFKRAEEKDLVAQELIEEYLCMLATGLNQYIYFFAPDIIVLGGGVAHALGKYLEDLRNKVTARIHSRYHVDIVLSKLKEEAGILGGACLLLWEEKGEKKVVCNIPI